MPSQEEYLDNLLKDVMNGGQAAESASSDGFHMDFFNGLPAEYDDSAAVEDSADPAGSGDSKAAEASDVPVSPALTGDQDAAGSPLSKDRYDIQDTADMSPEDIERILSESAKEGAFEDRADREKVDLETLLQEAEEVNLKDIGDMLQKADRNEPVDEGIIALLEQAQQQNAEIDWDDIEKQGNKSQPGTEKGLKGFFAKLRGKKKEAKKGKGSGRPGRPEEDREAASSGAEESALGNTDGPEMDELFGMMEAVGSGQDVSQADFLESPSEIRDVSEEEAKAELRDRDALPDGVKQDEAVPEAEDLFDFGSLEDAADPGSDSDDFGVSDALNILAGMDAPEGEETGPEGAEGKGSSGQKEAGRNKKPENKVPGKKGLFGRILDFLTQEDPEPEEEQQLILSDENDFILKELNEENEKKKKKKGRKKKAAKRGNDPEEFEDDQEAGQGKGRGKKAKLKKARKPRQIEPEEPGRRLSGRRVFLIFLICAAIGAAILVLGNAGIDFADKKKAAAAFYEGDYETCYQNLAGKHLNESQQVMYGKSESILRMRLWLREYEMFVQAGQEPEALDSLLQSVHDYPGLYQFSSQWNAAGEVQEIYDQMLEILQSKYGLTEEMAETIAGERDDLAYSRMVRAIAGGGAYGEWDEDPETGDPAAEDAEMLEDLLPEEEELGEELFVD